MYCTFNRINYIVYVGLYAEQIKKRNKYERILQQKHKENNWNNLSNYTFHFITLKICFLTNKGMNKIWKIFNLIVLGILCFICALGTFYKHIAFGWGLGDLLWYLFMYVALLTHAILTIISRNKPVNRHKYLTIIFLVFTIYICLQATIWRGSEYSWNGKIFYN